MYRLLPSVALYALFTTATACGPSDEIEVKVLGIQASEHHKEIDPKLTEFAKQAQKKDPKLTGFKLGRANCFKLKLGETQKFQVSPNETVEVTVNKERNEKGQIMLTIKPPKLSQITYTCTCEKFFSIATEVYEGKGKDKTQLFVAVMAKPCGGAKKKD
jgi:hypothetical protein